jgi:hypothetical protein
MSRARFSRFPAVLFATMAGALGVVGAFADGGAVETKVIAKLAADPMQVDGRTFQVSTGGAHAAWQVPGEGSVEWVVDGKAGTGHDAVGPLVFSGDGAHWAHFARVGAASVLVADGKDLPVPGLAPAEATLRFVPGGGRLAFLAKQVVDGTPGKSVVVIDGTPGPAFDDVKVETLAFSADGKRHAYVAVEGASEVVVLDGTPGTPHPRGAVGPPRFSADGTRVAWEVKKPEARVVVDGVPGPVFEAVTPPVFAPRGSRLWHMGLRARRPVVVVDGKEDPPLIDLAAPGPVWSPDGRHLGYAALKADGKRIVIDGKDGAVFKRIEAGSLRFSPDGRRHAYWAGNGPKPFWVVDGVAQAEVDQVGQGESFAFSPDSQRFAYRAQRKGKWVVVTGTTAGGAPGPPASKPAAGGAPGPPASKPAAGGVPGTGPADPRQEGPELDTLGANTPVFTPDSAHVVYHAIVAGAWHLFVDGKPGPAFEGFVDGTLAFGQDGGTVAIVARRAQAGMIVIDGVAAKETYPAMPPGVALTADGPRAFRTWFVDEQGFLLVRAELKR